MAEKGLTATLNTIHTCVAQHVIRVWIGSGARDLESTMAHGFVKYGFKVLLHHVVDGIGFTLPGLTHPVPLYPVYPCILGLNRAEVLRRLRNILHRDRPEFHSSTRLKERGVGERKRPTLHPP